MNLNKRAKEMNLFFNRVVDIDYDQKHLQKIKGKERVIDYLPHDVKNIIDLGSGTGLQLIKLYQVYPNVHTLAIDISDGMLKKLKERNISNNIEIVNASFFDYPFGKNMDAVISTQALHHFSEEDKLILYKKVYDSLKNGGLFINEDFFVDTLEEEQQKFKNYEEQIYGPDSHYDTPLTVEHEIDILRKVGFIVNCEITDDYKILVAKK